MNFVLFLPETILCGIILFYLCLSLFKNTPDAKTLLGFAVVGALAVLGAAIYSMGFSGELFFGTYKSDLLAQSFKVIISLGLLFTIFLSSINLQIPKNRTLEYLLFLFSATLGMVMMPSSVNWLTLYVSMELSSYSLYLLTALRQDRLNAESSLKYLLLGAASSGVFLWGVSLLVGLSGSVSLSALAPLATTGQPAFLIALFFALFAFLFKLSASPTHFWAPDVYQSASTPVANFIATASKAAAVAVFIRIFISSGVSASLASLLGVLAFVSMTLGNTVALWQKDVKRLLAYSSIAQAGYILVGLLSGTAEGYSSSLFYALAYLLMNAAVFLIVTIIAKSIQNDNPKMSDFNGLAERAPKLSLLLLLSLLSLAGIPPLAGFTGKWILFTAAMSKGHWFLVLWAVLNSVVSLFYYLTLVKHAYLEKPTVKEPIQINFVGQLLCLVLMLAIVGLGVFPNQFIVIAQRALESTALSAGGVF